jgi:hypothetical protein
MGDLVLTPGYRARANGLELYDLDSITIPMDSGFRGHHTELRASSPASYARCYDQELIGRSVWQQFGNNVGHVSPMRRQ